MYFIDLRENYKQKMFKDDVKSVKNIADLYSLIIVICQRIIYIFLSYQIDIYN